MDAGKDLVGAQAGNDVPVCRHRLLSCSGVRERLRVPCLQGHRPKAFAVVIASVEQPDGSYRSEGREPVCGEDFCDNCSDCLACQQWECTDGNGCRWVVYLDAAGLHSLLGAHCRVVPSP